MVDFQSRDTSRGFDDDDDEGDDEEVEQETADAEGETEDTGESEAAAAETTENEAAAETSENEAAAEATDSDAVADDVVETDATDRETASAEAPPDERSHDGETIAGETGDHDADRDHGAAGWTSAEPAGDDNRAASPEETEPVGSQTESVPGEGASDGEGHEAAETGDIAKHIENAVEESRFATSETEEGSGVGARDSAARQRNGQMDHDHGASSEHGHEDSQDQDTTHGHGGHTDQTEHAHGSHADDTAHAHGGHTDETEHAHGGHTHGHGHSHGTGTEQVGVAVVTISSTRTRSDDPSGDVIEAALEGVGHDVATRDVIRDDLDGIQNAIVALTARGDVDAVVTTGGTGVTPDDVTVEAVSPLFDKELPGFGELFRVMSYEDVGTKALASRATAGIVDGAVVFCLPGSEAAARLGMEELVTEEIGHLVGLAQRET